MSDHRLNVLVVDDDDVTAECITRSLRKISNRFQFHIAEDGLQALQMLRGEQGAAIPKPYLILLDLNMPRMNGFEFLEVLRADPALRDSVVFVLTTSDADADRSRAYNEIIAGYMVKSSVGPQFMRLSRLLSEYSEAVLLPD